MSSARERVEAAWDLIEYAACPFGIRIYDSKRVLVKALPAHHETLDEAYEAADAFTTERQEEIRQLRAEIVRIADNLWGESDWTRTLDDLHVQNHIVPVVRQQCAAVRTIKRLEAILSDKLRGMKQ